MLEDRLCIVLINWLRAQIDIRGSKFLDNRTKNVCIHHRVDLIAELELIQYYLNIGRKAVKVCDKVYLQCLRFCAAGQILQQKWRRIAKSLSCCIAQRRPLVINLGGIQLLFHSQYCRLCFFQHGIKTTDNRHRKNNITIFATHIYIT